METHPYRQAFVDRDLDRLVALFADDVVFHSPVITDPAFEGRDSVGALYAMVFDSFRDFKFTHDLSGGARASSLPRRGCLASRSD
jgi:ketosteroid isomerase-like protein